jgi:hypothetical protein
MTFVLGRRTRCEVIEKDACMDGCGFERRESFHRDDSSLVGGKLRESSWIVDRRTDRRVERCGLAFILSRRMCALK